jgi:predicted small secreted protein
MKKTWVILCVAIALPLLFFSCKKEKTQSYHVFWFDKATSDSLKAAGASFLYSEPDNYELIESDQWVYRTSINNWSDAETSGEFGLLFIRVFLGEGETKKVGYKISVGDNNDVPFSDQNYFLQHIPNLKGSVDFKYQNSTRTQLIWN